jgi:hypothetical protein
VAVRLVAPVPYVLGFKLRARKIGWREKLQQVSRQELLGLGRQRQQQTDAQRESNFQKAEAQRDVQQQLELARQGAQRDANERQKEARAVRLAQEAEQNRLNREAKTAAQYPGLAQGQQQGDLFGLTYPEAPPSTPFTPRAAPPEVSPDQLSMIGPRGGITKEAKRGTTTNTPAGKSTVVPSQPAPSIPPGGAAASGTGGVGGAHSLLEQLLWEKAHSPVH